MQTSFEYKGHIVEIKPAASAPGYFVYFDGTRDTLVMETEADAIYRAKAVIDAGKK